MAGSFSAVSKPVPELKPRVTSLKLEQLIYELAQLDENTVETQEARMDIVVESPKLRAMIFLKYN